MLTGQSIQGIKQRFWRLLVLCIVLANSTNVLGLPTDHIDTSLTETQIVLTELEKEAIASVREITLQLILISAGVFALVGGSVMSKERSYNYIWGLVMSFITLAISILFGILAYGSLIFNLSTGTFCVTGTLRCMAFIQWISFILGASFLIVFFLLNIKAK